jgi:hypothetical protein
MMDKMVSFTPRKLYPGEGASGSHSVGCWLGPRDNLDVKEKTFLPLKKPEPRFLCRLAHSLNAIPAALSRLPLKSG